jgi:hypothetical protein
MLDNLFKTIFDGTLSAMTLGDFVLCFAVALVLGVMLALICAYKNNFTKSFTVTLALLPSVVALVIIMVNGNLGTGIAVAGAFSLIRFRSAPGSAREICAIFIAMAAGLALGTGYLAYAALFTLVAGGVFALLSISKFGEKEFNTREKQLKVTISEDLDYTNIFDDLFSEYTEKWALTNVKTTNMGSMYKLTYRLTLKDANREKEFIDKLRCRNGNLEIVCGRLEFKESEL